MFQWFITACSNNTICVATRLLDAVGLDPFQQYMDEVLQVKDSM